MIGLVVSKPITDYSINRFMLSKYTISVEKGGIRGWVGLGRVGGKGGSGLNVWEGEGETIGGRGVLKRNKGR